MRLIDADALTDEIRHAIKISGSPWTHYGWTRKIVTDAPTIDPVKHGRWALKRNGILVNAVCTECTTEFSEPYQFYNYCPYCGAKMDETK